MNNDPRRIQFIAVAKPRKRFDEEGDECATCLFENERSAVCKSACLEARMRGLPDCEDGEGYVYHATKIDPRQSDLFEE